MADYSYIDPSILAQRQSLGNILVGNAMRPTGAPIANLITGLVGGYDTSSVGRDLQANQDYKTNFLANLPKGADASTLSSYLLGSQDPSIQNVGLTALLNPKKPDFGVIGEGPMGKQYGFISDNGTVTPYQAPQSASAVANSDVHGEDFLKTIEPQQAAQVKALAEGRMAFPQGFALKSPYWQNMLSAVSQYDPNFDAVNYNARSKTRNDFTSGTSAKQINAMNTVIGHLQTLSDAATALGNTNYPTINSAKNWLVTQTGGSAPKNFDTTKKAVVDELTRVWRQSGGSEQDIATWSQNIDTAGSPEQLHNVISQIGDLLESKINSLAAQYNQGMGTTEKPLRLLTPEADKALGILRQRAGGGTQPQAAPAPAAAPPQGAPAPSGPAQAAATIAKVRQAISMGHSPADIQAALVKDGVDQGTISQIMAAIAQGPQGGQ